MEQICRLEKNARAQKNLFCFFIFKVAQNKTTISNMLCFYRWRGNGGKMMCHSLWIFWQGRIRWQAWEESWRAKKGIILYREGNQVCANKFIVETMKVKLIHNQDRFVTSSKQEHLGHDFPPPQHQFGRQQHPLAIVKVQHKHQCVFQS